MKNKEVERIDLSPEEVIRLRKELEQKKRELEIEAALEKVRARTMAMHKSIELHDVIKVISEQIISLGIKFDHTTFIQFNNDKSIEVWVTTPEQPYPAQIHIPFIDHPFFKIQSEMTKMKSDFLAEIYDQEEKNRFFRHFFKNTTARNIPKERQKYVLQAPGMARYTFRVSSIYFSTANYNCIPYTDEETKILNRFANVFEQAYTRFLDLKKAEAQAREAQIEAALERVRNRTLLMKNSKELNEAVAVFFNEFKNLNLLPPEARTYFCDINTNNNTAEVWMTETDGKVMDRSHFTPLTKSASLKNYYKAWKNKLPISERIYTGKTLKEYLDFVSSLPHVKNDKDYQKIFTSPPEKIIMTDANFLQGNIGIMTFEKLSEEALAVLKRFARAFEFTYTRFLDLQKAEAQAREAQIEAALEKVRATAMAMQESSELNNVIREVSEQLTLLGFDFDITNIVTDISPEGFYIWNASPLESIISGVYVPYKNLDFIKWNYSNKEKNKTVSARFTKAQKNAFFRHYFTKTEGKNLSPERKKYVLDGQSLDISTVPKREFILDVLNYRGIIYSEEQNQILYRFANVFEQAYARFLDLKKAEAQAREAQIETALERVRSRSLGMQKSEELQNVVSEVFEQLQSLDFALDGAAFIGTRVENFMGIDFWMEDKITQPACFRLPYYDAPSINDIYNAWEKGKDFVAKIYGKEKNIWFDYAFEHTDLKIVPEDRKKWILAQSHLSQAVAFGKNSALGIHAHHIKKLTDTEIDILRRFSKVFEQGYVRFLDLKNAEAQAREAQIEAALERVRSRSIGMQKSEELSEVVISIDREVAGLGISVDSSSIITDFDLNEKEKGLNNWIAIKGNNYLQKFHIPNAENTITRRFWDELADGADHYVDTYSKSEKNRYFRWLFKYSDFKIVPDERQQIVYDFDGWTRATIISKNSLLIFQRYSLTDYNKEDIEVFKRFGKVFDQAYTRFLDLQKAETQAREAQIEAALERVRSRSLAMHKSSELKQVVSTVFEQIKELKIETYTASIFLLSEQGADMQVWIGMDSDHEYTQSIKVPEINHPIMAEYNHYIKTRKPYVTYSMNFEEKNSFWNLLFEHSDFKFIPEERKKFLLEVEAENAAVALQKNTGIQLVRFNNNSFSEKDGEILQRFTKVFEQAYTRFLDLKKAEEQAREAQIEAALERVRAQSMAMHKSDELQEVISVIFKQIVFLGIKADVTFIAINVEKSKDFYLWLATENNDYARQIKLPYFKHPIHDDALEAINQQVSIVMQKYSREEKNRYYEYVLKHSDLKYMPEERKKFVLDAPGYTRSIAINKYTSLSVVKYVTTEFSKEDNEILIRIAKVFEQAYTRFLDIQKAEVQAREAKIEAALEKVRGKAMAMHNSNDLSDTVSMVFTELRKLGVNPIRSGVGLFSKEARKVQLYSAIPSATGDSLSLVGWVILEKHPVLEKIYETWLKQEDYFPEMQGEALRSYYQSLLAGLSVPMPEFKNDDKQFGHFITSSIGCLYAWSEEPFNDDQKKILKRFASVVNLTFKRYFDLQKAESQAREAIKQASLDRVRGEIASMRTSEDLNRITPVIWRELQTLEVPFIRCGVFIINEKQKKVHVYLTTPSGKALAALHLSLNANDLTKNTVEHWKGRRIFKTHWDKKDFIAWTKSMMEIGQVENAETYQGATDAPESLNLHFVPFRQGMLYVGDVSPLPDEKIELVKTLAEVFSIAYARYEDFKQLEEAKTKIENTLTDLKAAQTQLIQSEKMASLGELTAGIAHEIQNPLNFVNNFSEVSSELLEELKEEIENGNLEEVKALTSDLFQNLEKINNHGKRASSIVKGMLLHSRGSSGQKEPTDINALADEYLRLSYHGFRAKDKSFNADFKLELDESLPKIEVIPQDIGRVLLNLINNAFYVVSSKTKSEDKNYKPTVTVTTKHSPSGVSKGEGKVQIIVSDNGPGIPSEIKNKIFQPFFTTKPTGSGTGLGLSLSYDIIKAHGGTISVESLSADEAGKKNEGTEFIINIPIT